MIGIQFAGKELPDLLDYAEVQGFVQQTYQNLQSAGTLRQSKVIEYLQELNGNSVVPDPDPTTGDWQTNLKSSLFFQKTIFAYLYLRSLIQKTTSQLVSFDSGKSKYLSLPSAFKKIFDWAVYRTNYFDAIDKALFYALLTGQYAVSIDASYEVDEFDDISQVITCKALHPLQFYWSADKTAFAVDEYIPLEKAYALAQTWEFPQELKPYNRQTNLDLVNYYVLSLTQKPFVKLTYVYTRYYTPQDVSVPYKFTLLNDLYLVDYQQLSDADRRFPIIISSFYSEDMQMSYADLLWDYYKEDSRFLRAIVDRALLSTAMGFELNTLAMSNEKEFVVKPFTVVFGTGEDRAIKPFQLATFDPNVLPVRQLITNEAQNVSALTEFLMGLPTSKGRPTAKEVAMKTQMNQQIISTIIYRLENVFIRQTALKLLALHFQYMLDDCLNLLNPAEKQEMSTLINQALLENKPKYYYIVKELYKGVDIRVEGISGVMKQKDDLERLMNFVEMASQMNLTPFIDIPKVFESILKKMELPSDIVRIPSEKELEALWASSQQKVSAETASIYKSILEDPKLFQELVAHKAQLIPQIAQVIASAQNPKNLLQGEGND